MSMRKLVVFLVTAAALCGQGQFEFWPGATYDPAVPTFEKVLGYGAGGKLASHLEIVKYFEALAAASGGRMKVVEYAKSWAQAFLRSDRERSEPEEDGFDPERHAEVGGSAEDVRRGGEADYGWDAGGGLVGVYGAWE